MQVERRASARLARSRAVGNGTYSLISFPSSPTRTVLPFLPQTRSISEPITSSPIYRFALVSVSPIPRMLHQWSPIWNPPFPLFCDVWQISTSQLRGEDITPRDVIQRLHGVSSPDFAVRQVECKSCVPTRAASQPFLPPCHASCC